MRLASLFSDSSSGVERFLMRCEGQDFYADCLLICLLFAQEICTNRKIYNQVAYPQTPLVPRIVWGSFNTTWTL